MAGNVTIEGDLVQSQTFLGLPRVSLYPSPRYCRLLAWVWLEDGRFVGGELVRLGYAQVYTFSDNPDHADYLLACEREVREARRGLWGD